MVSDRSTFCTILSQQDGTIRIWDVAVGKCEKILSSHLQSVTCLKWGGTGLLYTASQDRTIKVWRADDVSTNYSIVFMSDCC